MKGESKKYKQELNSKCNVEKERGKIMLKEGERETKGKGK